MIWQCLSHNVLVNIIICSFQQMLNRMSTYLPTGKTIKMLSVFESPNAQLLRHDTQPSSTL